jgi:hypothetical protein
MITLGMLHLYVSCKGILHLLAGANERLTMGWSIDRAGLNCPIAAIVHYVIPDLSLQKS